MHNGSDEGFRNIWRMVIYAVDHVWNLIVMAWKMAYAGNSIAIWMTAAIVVFGLISYLIVKFSIVSSTWLQNFTPDQRRYYETLRDYLCSTKVFTVGVFFISSVLFVIVNTISNGAAGYPFSQSDLSVISFVGKAGVVICVLIRMARFAVALKRVPT